MKRTRQQVTPAEHGGGCLPLEELDSCNIVPCPIDCELGQWGNWTACDAECDGGLKRRSRNTLVEPDFGGIECGDKEETKRCNMRLCDESDQQPCSHISCEYKIHPDVAEPGHTQDVQGVPGM